MLANIGAKKMEKKKHSPVMQAVSPVIPPSEMPAPDSTNAVTGGDPKREPKMIPKALTRYATVEPSKSWVSSSIAPQKRAILYRVPVKSRMSTYKKVTTATAKLTTSEELACDKCHSCAASTCLIGWNVTTCLKNSKDESPVGVFGKLVTGVPRGHDTIATSRIPKIRAPRTRYIIRKAVRSPPTTPSHSFGLLISPDVHICVVGSNNSGMQPASASGSVFPPVTAPIPALYERPMIVR
jgi:hypothetical protein